MRANLLRLLRNSSAYLRATGKWLIVSVITGAFCGVVGTVFHLGVEYVTELRDTYEYFLYSLPIIGLLIGGIYRLFGTSGINTNNVLEEVHSGKKLSIALLPSIFLSTILTHLGGGSAGREGAALQMGGVIGFQSGRLMRLDDMDLRTATTIGMSAFFAALFGTPVAATVFALEITTVGRVYYAQMLPCLIASLTAHGIALFFGVKPTAFTIPDPELSVGFLLRVGLLAVLCAFVSVLFCETIHSVEKQMEKRVPNEWLRVVLGGSVIVVLTLMLGTTDYNGAGMEVIARAVERGETAPEAFAIKLLFTAVTLASGYKGGEVVPSFFVGATFGCLVGPMIGIHAGFAAAIGLVSVFCGAVNCPLASVFLALELFDAAGLPFFALSCAISYVLSGYSGIYSSQHILYDKLKTQYINIRTDEHHLIIPTDSSP